MSTGNSILIIGDSPQTRQALEACFRGLGYDVLVAADGVSGFEIARRERPNVVLTDMLLTGMSGFRIVDRLKSDPAYQPIVIMMSAIDAPLQRAYAEALGVDEYIVKPFSLGDIVACVRRLLHDGSDADLPVAVGRISV